ncbi:coiled-coil domain-containing protein 22 [Flavobacterium sp. AS60]|uniref:coiled-coil domain-containing protein n=1 Tax=Flavobacterium anseongense TaxID=2910677 RepID=UPI001F3EF275|nr:coiled-coil domain-containing protein 22 [Flavobacterium sp. AS60]MCF6129469.1 coiled-coil domain-containing protein 22 [Flavobacterium sp. AS60]
MKTRLFYSLLFIVVFQFTLLAQDKKSTDSSDKKSFDNIYMTWNKDTPESEMNDDIKALKEHGVTISYSDIKRNSKGEITAIKVEYADINGSNGSMSLNSPKPINTIKIYKQDDEVGFGEPSGSDFINGNNFAYGFNPNDMMKGFQFNGNEDGLPGQQYHFEFPNGNAFGESNSKIIIKKDGKKPLVIENGNVVEGGDDYTKEELEQIKKDNKVESFSSHSKAFGNMDIEKQMKKMQEQIDQMMSQQPFSNSQKEKSDVESTTEEMKKATEEMKKAKAEMEKAKKELQNAKSSLKTQKA